MALSMRRLVLLVTLVTFALARQPESSLRRRTMVRGASSHRQQFIRSLGIDHGDRSAGGKGDKNKGKSHKTGGDAKHKGNEDDVEVEEPNSDPEELPTATNIDVDDSDHKSPKGGPGAKGDKGSHGDKGGDKVTEKGKGKEKVSEYVQHGENKTMA